MKSTRYLYLALALFAAPALTACAGSSTSESTGEYVDDSAITAKVKAAMLEDAGLEGFDIGVETFKNAVQLSGFVETESEKVKAGQVARSVDGVRSVKNDLVVK